MLRAFIAVEVSAFSDIVNFMEELRKAPPRIKLVDPENLHITLRFLGDINEEDAHRLSEAMKSLETFEAFSFSIESAGAFPSVKNPRVIWAGVKDAGSLSELQKKVEDICESEGFGREKREFSPHLTIGRLKDRNTLGIRPVIEKYRDISFGEVAVKELKLKKSVLTPEGPVYSDIAVVKFRHP